MILEIFIKRILSFTLIAVFFVSCSKETKTQIVEASCGQCQFDMIEKAGCDLAVRIDGQAYFVDNSSIDEHGDGHAEDGLCSTIRKAKVTGDIAEGRFKSKSFELIR